ncbi:mandelate racemase/muconate lactonizing enzyme family protein [Actinoallomurus sp. CA-150999]|uniref:mandelate racemase/muconate lactonizing enzyme family protein n=1 Tax=Actinoallomurus sp. CA-150999 TaxID=3239887 RepID=UPI003D93F19E
MRITGLRSFVQRVGERPRVLVRVDTDEGVSGWGEAYNHGPDLALVPLLDYLGGQIRGEDPRRVEYLSQLLIRTARFPQGALGLAAIAAIDHALWDITAKALGVPVYQVLGGAVRDRVRVYCGLYSAPDPDDCRRRTVELHERYGFTAFKLSPFRSDLHATRWGLVVSEAAEWAQEVRRSCPEEFDFAFDAHAKIFEPYQAVQLGNALAPMDPRFLEEPIRPEHFASWGRLRGELQVPLATGESLYSPHEFLQLLTHGGADIVQPDICVVGGISQLRRIATIAETFNVMLAPHNPMGPLATAHNVHFAAACSNFSILEYKPETTSWCPDPYVPVDGHLELRPDRPGWGVTIDEAALAEDDYVHWERRVPTRPDGSLAYC